MNSLQNSNVTPVPLEAVLCTEELQRRPHRQPDFAAENRALVAMTKTLAETPYTILQSLTDTTLATLHCGSVGVSMLTTDGKEFTWPAIAGAWKSYFCPSPGRHFSPSGDVLDRKIPLLLRNPERRYTYLRPITPEIEEVLLVPFWSVGKAVGTLWAISHGDTRRLDLEDQRLMVSFSAFASVAYQALGIVNANARLAAIVESSDDAIVSKNLNGIIQSWNRGAERIFGYSEWEAVGQPITIIIPHDRLAEEPAVLERIRRGERIDHFETIRRRKDGSLVNVSLTVSPITDMNSKIIGASKIARVIPRRKKPSGQSITPLPSTQD